jgi:signal transduction histidine kinase/ActR/RegA family two-component response regulator/PAS domain-containing protein
MMKLHIIEGPGRGKIYDLKKETTSVGRSTACDIRIGDRAISARHLKLIRTSEGILLEDLGSTNGTYLNGELVIPGDRVPVGEGDPIAIGNSLICIDKGFMVNGTLVLNTPNLDHSIGKPSDMTWLLDRPMTNPRNLRLIYRVSHVLTESLDIHEILEKIMSCLLESLSRVDRCAILLLDEDKGDVSEIISRSRQQPSDAKIEYSRSIVDRVIREGKPILVQDTSSEKEIDLSDSLKSLRIRSVICVPLISRSHVRGAIYADTLEIPNGFRNEDLYLLAGISSPAAIAIENALLYANLEKMAESRTRSLQETERRLRHSEARFRAIFENMQSGVIVCSMDESAQNLFVLDMNRAAEMIEGKQKESVIGKPLFETLPIYGKLGVSDMIKNVWATGKPQHLPPTLLEAEEASAWRQYDIYRLPSGEMVMLCDDVTAKVLAEEEQQDLQRKLIKSQRLESVGRLAGGVAHNFRNILQAILGNAEYLEMNDGGNDEVLEVVRNINNSVNKGVDLVNSLLHFSSRGEDFEETILDVAEVIRETHRITTRMFDKRFRINLELGERLFIVGNRTLLSQAFMNLLTNAKDAMPDGGEVRISGRKIKKRVVVHVSDTGHGMDKATEERIFEPFFTSKEVGKGTGLGLSSVHGIVEQHHGSISVASKPGKGTTFRLAFPAVEEMGESQFSEPSKVMHFGNGQKVMIVDDEKFTLDAMAAQTRALGYEVLALETSTQCLKEYLTWKPDVVLMDRDMPEMDGISCIKEILKADKEAKIVIVSGYEESWFDAFHDSMGGLIKGYLTKPCGMDALGQALESALRQETLPLGLAM